MPRNPFNYKSDADCNGYIYALMWLGSRVLLLGSGTALLWMGILYTTTMFSIGELLMGLAIVAPCLGSAWMLNNLVRRQKDFDLERSMIKIKRGLPDFPSWSFRQHGPRYLPLPVKPHPGALARSAINEHFASTLVDYRSRYPDGPREYVLTFFTASSR